MKTEPTVFVLDEHGCAGVAIRDLVRTLGVRCKTYASERDLMADVDASFVGCLVAELSTASISGTDLLKRLSSKGALLPVVFATNEIDVPTAVETMLAGAFHLLERPFREQELWDAIQEAIQLSVDLAEMASQQETIEERLERLTKDERQLLQVVARNKPAGAIAAEMGVGVRAIEVRRDKLMKKFDIPSLSEFVQFAAAATCNGNGGGNGKPRGDTWRKPVHPR